MSIFTQPLRAAIRWSRDWPVQSQQAARRNALVATTQLAHNRAEIIVVEDFLAAAAATRGEAAQTATTASH